MSSDPISIASLVVAIVTLILGTVVSVVVYRLGRRVDFRSRMRRWDKLRRTINKLFVEQRDSLHDVILMNAKRYEKDYDGGNDANRHGFIMQKTELLDTRHDGVELVAEVVATWIDPDGQRTIRRPRKGSKGWSKAGNVLAVGFVPFDWIEHVNLHGDEYRGEVIINVLFKGPGKSPFRHFRFVEGQGRHLGPSNRLYFDPVDELGILIHNRVVAWFRFQRSRITVLRMDRQSARKWREQQEEMNRRKKPFSKS